MKMEKFFGEDYMGRAVAYYPRLARFFGYHKIALFVCQFGYWEGKQMDKARGFIYKTQREINFETVLTRYEQETARKFLKTKGYLEEELRGTPAVVHYRFDWDKIKYDFTYWLYNEDVHDQYLIETPD